MTESQASKHRILVVDDDLEIRELLRDYLGKQGFDVVTAENGDAMLAMLQQYSIDLIVLDIMMPGVDGLTLCKQIRAQASTPIVMLTASGEETDRIVGLELGADDYLPKPFSPRELVARIRAVLRRVSESHPATHVDKTSARYVCFAQWRLDTVTRSLHHLDGGVEKLGAPEFHLLQTFLASPNKVIGREQLSYQARGREHMPYDRTIDIQISRLRQQLRDDGKQQSLILTVRGEGYVFAANLSYEN